MNGIRDDPCCFLFICTGNIQENLQSLVGGTLNVFAVNMRTSQWGEGVYSGDALSQLFVALSEHRHF